MPFMPTAITVAATCIGLMLLLTLGVQQELQEDKIKASAGQQYTSEQAAIEPKPIKFGPTPAEPSGDKHYRSRGEDAGEGADDHLFWGEGLAQWIMAFTGFLALGVSAWAVWLLKSTLVATREAVRAADDAVKETRRIGEAQVRAYLSISDWTQSVGDHPTKVVILRPMLRNSGQSPAYIQTININVDQQFGVTTHPIKTGHTSPTLIGPGEKIAAYSLESTEDVADATLYPLNSVRLSLEIIFWDEFGQRELPPNRSTRQAFHIKFTIPFVAINEGNVGDAIDIESEGH